MSEQVNKLFLQMGVFWMTGKHVAVAEPRGHLSPLACELYGDFEAQLRS